MKKARTVTIDLNTYLPLKKIAGEEDGNVRDMVHLFIKEGLKKHYGLDVKDV